MDDHKGLALAFEEAKKGYEEGGVPIGAALVAADGRVLGRGHNMRVQSGNPILHVSMQSQTLCYVDKTAPGPLGIEITPHNTEQATPLMKTLSLRLSQGETSCLQNAGRLPSSAYRGSTMYTTLSPCDMCTGACLLYGIPRVVIGENNTFLGGEAYLKQRGVEVIVVDSPECRELMDKFIAEKPEVWNEDIGVEERVHSRETLKRI
ncbi:putative cytosine deaminase [Nemania sp. FL0916]|nr:putative cytosine deaminase [Nemania sp. FL0916]